MHGSTIDIVCEMKNVILMIYNDIYKLYENDIDKIYLINREIKKVMIQLKQNLVQKVYCVNKVTIQIK